MRGGIQRAIVAVLVMGLVLLVGGAPSRPSEAAGSFGQSLLFASVSGQYGHVEVPHAPALNLGSTFTIEAWIKPALATSYPTIASKDYTSAWWFGVCNSPPRIGLQTNNGQVPCGQTTLVVNVWTHVAATFDNGTVRFYLNGDFDGSATDIAVPAGNSKPLYLGKDASSGAFPYTGYLAEVRLWNVARSNTDIRETMHTAIQEPLPGLVAVWNLQDGLHDPVGGYHGTAKGGAASPGFQPGAPPPRPKVSPIDTEFIADPSQPSVAIDFAGRASVPDLNRLIIAGGTTGLSYVDQILAVDATSGKVTRLAGKLPQPRAFATAAYAPERRLVYLFGGVTSSGFTSDGAVLAIDPADGTTRVVNANLPAGAAAAITHPATGQIWIFGGWQGGEGFTPNSLATIWRFDPTTETVTTASFTLPAANNSLSVVASRLTGKIYLLGGGLVSAPPVSRTIFEVTANPDGSGSIRALPTQLPVANVHQALAEDPVSGLILIVGGFFTANRVIAFDPVTEQIWETPLLLPEQRVRPGLVYSATSRQALVVGGEGGGLKNTVWRIPFGDGPAVPVGRWDFPEPVASAVRSIHGDEDGVAIGTASTGVGLYRAGGTMVSYGDLLSTIAVRWDPFTQRLWMLNDATAAYRDFRVNTNGSFGPQLGANRFAAIDLAPVWSAATGVRENPTFHPLLGQHVQTGSGELTSYSSARILFRSFDDALLQTGPYWTATAPAGASLIIPAIAHSDLNTAWFLERSTAPNSAVSTLKRMEYFGFLRPDDFPPTITSFGSPCGAGNLMTNATSMAWGTNNDLWIAAIGGGLGYIGGICRVTNLPGVPVFLRIDPSVNTVAYDVTRDRDGRIWVTRGGTSVLPGGGLSVFQSAPTSGELRAGDFNWLNAPIGSRTYSAAEGGWVSQYQAVGAVDERVWLGGYGLAGGLPGRLATVTQRWARIDRANDIRSKIIDKVFLVRGRAFLAGAASTGGGLFILQPDGVTWDNRTGIQARAVFGDRRGRIWVGADDGVRLYTPTGWASPTDVGTPPAGPVRAFAEDSFGRIWIGGDGGLTLFDRGRYVATFTSANSALPSTLVRALVVDRDDRLWVGTTNGLARLDGGFFTVLTGLPSPSITDLVIGPDGRVVVSTGGGTRVWTGSAFAVEGVAPNLPLDVDGGGGLWLGASRKNPEGYQNYYWTNSGLMASTVSDVTADKADRVWFSHAPNPGVSIRGAYLPPLPEVIPTISSISPDSAANGANVTITGTGFGTNPGELEVRLGGVVVPIVSVSPTSLVVRVTEDVVSGDVTVRRLRRSSAFARANRPAFCAIPTISSFTPTGGNLDVEVTINGANFDPAAQLALGGALRGVSSSPRQIRTRIQPGDASGNIRVRNATSGCPAHEATAAGFNVVIISLEYFDINQGLPSVPLVSGKPSLLRLYVSSPNRRSTDVVRLGSVEVYERDPINHPEWLGPNILTVPGTASLNVLPARQPSAAEKQNISLSFNLPFYPLGHPVKRVVLKNGPYTLAQQSRTFETINGGVHTLMLVPIMPPDYTPQELAAFKASVDANLDHVRRRIMPFGSLSTIWSYQVVIRQNVKLGGTSVADNRRFLNLNIDIDRARKYTHSYIGGSGAYAVGLVHPRSQDPSDTSVRGKSLIPESEFESILMDIGETFCDVGTGALRVVTFGLADLTDQCDLDMPRTVFVSKEWNSGLDANGIPTSTVSYVIAHELAHSLGLVHPNAGNYAKDIADRPGSDRHSKYDDLDGGVCGDGGITFNPQLTLYSRDFWRTEPVVNPLNPITLTQLRPNPFNAGQTAAATSIVTTARDLLSYACNRRDVNAYYNPYDFWQMLKDYRLYPDAGKPGTSVLSERSPAATPTIRPRPIVGERVSVTGVITPEVEAGNFEDVRALGPNAFVSPSYATGYFVAQVDASGAVLSQIGVDLLKVHRHEPVPPGQRDGRFFSTTIVLAPDTVALQLRKGDKVLATFAPGGAAPSVVITSPTGGSFDSGSVPVAWTASDPDGDLLRIDIEYSRDGTTWHLVETAEGNGSVNLPVAVLGGSSSARVRVRASDGLRSALAVSAPFAVAPSPPIPYIAAPHPGTGALESRPVELRGSASDAQDGTVVDSGLAWFSSRDGALGTGNRVSAILRAGRHTISLVATNSAGLQATATVELNVAGDYDGDGVPDSEDLSKTLGLSPLDGNDIFRETGGLPLIVKLERGLNPNVTDTDGDGRSDADELAQGTDPRTPDQPPSLVDTLMATPTTITLTYQTSFRTIPQGTVLLGSRAPANWSASSDAPWLIPATTSGKTIGPLGFVTNPRDLAPGVHRATLTVQSAELGSTVAVQVVLNVIDTGPSGGPGPLPPSRYFAPGITLNTGFD